MGVVKVAGIYWVMSAFHVTKKEGKRFCVRGTLTAPSVESFRVVFRAIFALFSFGDDFLITGIGIAINDWSDESWENASGFGESSSFEYSVSALPLKVYLLQSALVSRVLNPKGLYPSCRWRVSGQLWRNCDHI